MTLHLNLRFGDPAACPLAKAIWRILFCFIFFNSLVLFICFALIHKLGFLPLLFVPVAVISLQSGLGAWVVSGVDGTA